MKKVLVLSVIALASCGKFKFENKIQGEWKMSEARLSTMSSWEQTPQEVVTITESNISNPWNTTYSVSGKTIIMNNQTIKVEVKKNNMLWVFENTDSLRFIR